MIHLLVDVGVTPKRIYNAVLIDGGMPGLTYQKIVEVIERIERSGYYDFDPNGHFGPGTGNLRFDSIVITHWDKDHWGGVRDLLLYGYRTDVAAHPQITAALQQGVENFNRVKPRPVNRKWDTAALNLLDPIQFDFETRNNVQCRYIKYAQAPSGTPFRLRSAPTPLGGAGVFDPITTLYAPYQYVTRFDAAHPLGNPASDGVGTPTMKVEGRIVFRCNDDGQYVKGGGNTLDILLMFKYPRSWPTVARPTPQKKEFRFLRACRLIANSENYLGAELLKNMPAPAAGWPGGIPTVANPTALLGAYGITVADGPRIFIVAGAQRLINPALLPAVAATAAPPNVASRLVVPRKRGGKVVDSRVPGPWVGIFDDTRRTGSIPMNSPSICCVMLTAIQGGGGFKLKHYFAGDALWDMEAAVAAWLQAGAPAPAPPLNTPFMKLSQ